VGVWFLLIGVGIFFAQNSYRAFFGDLERAEGFLGLLFFFLFFVLVLFMFEKKEWMRFLQAHLGVGAILFIDGLFEFLKGDNRAASFTGNPIYLAQIFLFVFFSALVVWNYYRKEVPNVWWRIGAIISAFCSLIGIVILTQTRGVMVGMVVGVVVVLLYAVFRGKDLIVFKNISARMIAGILLFISVICGGVFVITKDASLWQKIPGVDRIAQTLSGVGTETRVISFRIGLDAMNPQNEGWGKFFIGWGQENFSNAYNTYFNPQYFRHEQKWFDRAHNKLMDVFVMNGLLGFIAYVGVWISVFWYLFRGKKFSFTHASGLFFGVAYFVQNLTVFDSVSTYIPFFAFLAWAIYMRGDSNRGLAESIERQKDRKEVWWKRLLPYKIFGVGVVLTYVLIAWTWVPINQTRSFLSVMRGLVPQTEQATVLQSAFVPYTYAQDVIRTNLITKQVGLYDGSAKQDKTMIVALQKFQELLDRESTNPRFFLTAGQGYEAIGKSGNMDYLRKAQALYEQAQALAPQRQDIFYVRAYNKIYELEDNEAEKIINEAIALDPQVATSHFYKGLFYAIRGEKFYTLAIDEMEYAFSLHQGSSVSNPANITFAYYLAMKYFYDHHNAAYAKKTALRLRELTPKNADNVDKLVGFIDSGSWVRVQWGD